jgi:hypothetical protein
MLGSTAFVFGEDSRASRQRTINRSLQGGKQFVPKSITEKVYHYFISNVFLTCGSLYIVWTGIGILFYTYYDSWTAPTAYFYAMEAGLSIGFCNPLEVDDFSKLFTIFYVLGGSIIISGSVGLLASSLFYNTTPVIRVTKKQIFERMKKYDVEHSIYYENMDVINEQTTTDENTKNNKNTKRRRSSTTGSNNKAPDGPTTICDNCTECRRKTINFLKYIWYHLKYYFGWYSNRFRAIITFLLIFWFGLGTAYGVIFEEWTVITSLYWAVTAASTGGLQSPVCIEGTEGKTCNFGDVRGSLMSIWMMISVPLYATAFGQYARMAVKKTLRYREQNLLKRPMEDAEFLFAANVLSPEGSETLVLGEYILLELMRLGITDPRQIEAMKRKFHELDTLNRGEIDIDDLKSAGKVVPAKKEVYLDI